MPVSFEQAVNALKGIQGTGSVFGKTAEALEKIAVRRTLEPGDFSRGGDSQVHMSAPLGYDLWYLSNDVNLVSHIDPTTDSEEYVSDNLKFLAEKLGGIKPLKALDKETLKSYGGSEIWEIEPTWANEGAYFIQVMAFELGQEGTGFDFDSNIPGGYDKDLYCGGLMFPVGQLGVMEVVSLFQETELEAEGFSLTDEEIPTIISQPAMFPPMEYAGEDRSFGRYLVYKKGYLVPDADWDRVELMAPCGISPQDYTQDVTPKSWTKVWIKKTDTFPVPGEFIGILVKPMSVPPHVWWFQESTPLLYAGNWAETQNLTSGVITLVTLEADRTDGGIGDEYWVRVNGIEFIAYASDFKRYAVNERVGVLKRWTVTSKASRSFTWKDQRDGTHPVKNEVSLEFVIIPVTFYVEQ